MTLEMMDSVDKRTQLAGQNRMEMLMFRLDNSGQLFGINVFKVREVTQCPKLTKIPKSNPVVCGIADFRGKAIPVIDFSMAIGGPKIENIEESLVVISEYNRSVQALVVKGVERIVNLTWDEVKSPPPGAGSGSGSYITAVTEVDGKIVEIIDVERIIEEVHPTMSKVSEEFTMSHDSEKIERASKYTVLLADDSTVALHKVEACMRSIGVKTVSTRDGKEALDYLKALAKDGKKVTDELLMLVSDVEMPKMDGYTLVTEIRFDPALSDLYVVLHTSLSGVFNESLVKKVGANNFIAKFQPDNLANSVLERIDEVEALKS